MSENKAHHTQRDAETLSFLGLFLIVLSIPVMIGTLWAGDNMFYHVVNFVAGAIIFIIGSAFLYRGRLYAKENK